MSAVDSISSIVVGQQSEHDLQAFHSLLLDQLPIGLFHKDKAGRYIFVNAWYCRFKGISADAFIGRTADEVAASQWKPEDKGSPHSQREAQILKDGSSHHELIMRTGQPVEVEEHHVDQEGNERFFHVMKGPLFGWDGALIGSQGILIDITERKRAEAQFAHERNMTAALLNFSTDSIYFKDRASRFLRVSAGMARMFGLTGPDEMVGKRDFDYFREDHAREAFEDEQDIIRSGKSLIGKIEKETFPDGRVAWALTSKMPLRNGKGEIIGTFGTSKDITAFKQAEAKLEELHGELLNASRKAGMAEVATNVLHNVGNVLNSVNISTTLLLEAARKSKGASLSKVAALLQEHASDLGAFMTSDAKGRQLPTLLDQLARQMAGEQEALVKELESLRQNVEHIKEIVAMQQNYAVAAGVTEIVDLAELMEDVVRMNMAALARHEVELVREYEKTPPLTLEKHKVLQILVNLIRNAKYACDESGRTDKQIRLKISQRAGWVSIAVIDNGVGIATENRTRIFNHGFTTRKGGHGFGLHSGALAAKELGGSLSAHSEGAGMGAIFTLELPVPTAA